MNRDSVNSMPSLPAEMRNALLLSVGVFLAYLFLWVSGVQPFGINDVSYLNLYRKGYLSVYLGAYLFYFVPLLALSGISSWKQMLQLVVVGASAVYLLPESNSGSNAFDFEAKLGAVEIAVGGLALLHLFLGLRDSDTKRKAVVQQLLGIGLLILIMVVCVPGVLSLTTLLHPATFDAIVFQFDQVLGFQASVVLATLMEHFPWLGKLVRLAYRILPMGFAVLFALQFRYPERRNVNLVGFWIISVVGAIIVYHLYPVAGPRYFFGAKFPNALPPLDTIPDFKVVIPPAFRNGVPSMHFGWAFAFWLTTTWLRPIWIRVAFAILLALNIVATLGTGEHYLLDLIVALPYTLAVYALCLKGICPITARRTAIQNAALFVAWLAVLRFGLPLVQFAPVLLWGAVLFTLFFSFVVVRRLARSNSDDVLAEKNVPSRSGTKMSRELWLIAGIFIFSGFSGLVYEVVFAKSLALVFGSASVATYTVLATYMGGMSLGAGLGGWLQDRLNKPLLAYAFCEVAIGVYCAMTPLFFPLMQSAYVSLASGSEPASSSLLLFRLGLGAIVLLVPTVLMGMTMPFLVRYFSDRREQLGVSVALLYSTNTLGAAIGALLTGYVVIPVFGISSTTFLAAGLNLAVALAAAKIFFQFGSYDVRPAAPEPIAQGEEVYPVVKSLGWVGLIVLTFGGAITLALETSYIHLLAVVAGNSAYAFSLMLFTFLLGLSVGAVVIKRLLKSRWPLAELLAWLEFGLALVILLGVYSWETIPGYFSDYSNYPRPLNFAEREFIRGFVCWLAMFPPAVLIGAIYPVAMECVGQAFPARKVRMLGYAMALNTAGNIAGVIVCGFLLLPIVGALTSIHILAWTAIALAIVAALAGKSKRKVWALAPLPLVLLVFWWQPSEFDYTELASGTNVYFAPQNRGVAIDHSESLDGGLTTVAIEKSGNGSTVKTLLTNGKFQGNDAEHGEVKAQVGFALAPLLHTAERGRVLVIGYGTGMSARTLHDAGFLNMDVVELSGDIMRIADQHFGSVNKGVSSAAGVKVHVTDGRNFLLLNPATYDLVSMEISSIWFAGAASLYNREFYQLVKRRLNPDGVLQQWIQLHHLRTADLVSILATLHSEFRYVWLYYIGGQGILVASNSENTTPNLENAHILNSTTNLAPLLSLYGGSADVLMDALIAPPEAINKILTSPGLPPDLLVSTDNNLYLEYGTPRGNALDAGTSLATNLAFLKRVSQKQ